MLSGTAAGGANIMPCGTPSRGEGVVWIRWIVPMLSAVILFAMSAAEAARAPGAVHWGHCSQASYRGSALEGHSGGAIYPFGLRWLRLRGGGSGSVDDGAAEGVEERVGRETKVAKKRRREKKKWAKVKEEKELEKAVDLSKPQIIHGSDGVIYALDPDFPEEINFVPRLMKPLDEDNELDLRIMNATEQEEWEDASINQEAKQYEYLRRKPLADAELEKEVLDLLTECEKVKQSKRGANEVTKAINRNMAEFIMIAADVIPIEIVLHLPVLCEDKGVPFVWVSTREKIGKACGLPRPVTAAAVLSNEQSHLSGRIRKTRIKVDNLAY